MKLPPSPFRDAYVQLVDAPWEAACKGAESPWLATPELRAKWSEGMGSADPMTALASAIGLARVGRPSEDEFKKVNVYFADPPEGVVDDAVTLDLLLTGGLPPLVLCDTFFNQEEEPDFIPPFIWPAISAYLRHPSLMIVAQMILDQPSSPPITIYSSVANPCFTFREDFTLPQDHPTAQWIEALHIFHPNSPKPDKSKLKTDLQKFAYFMRCDFEKKEFMETSRAIIMNDPYFHAQLDHPCAFSGPAPKFDPTNPNLAALQYFAFESSVSALYRFYNPMLSYPWHHEEVSISQEDWVCMAMLLFGHTPLHITRHRISDKNKLKELIDSHPAWQVNQFVDLQLKAAAALVAEQSAQG